MSSESKLKKKKNRFGATSPPFIDYLKEILRRYPDGGQILKELIQNADDAGASSVVFIHDERHYGTQSLWSEELRKYQGPALYAFNDAAFTDEDWEGIQKVGRSIKHDDPTKVGRFGIGFNSVYHITDLPCVFSSKHLAIFDPQKMIFGDDQEGYRWSIHDDEDRQNLLSLRDQFQPFQTIVSLVNKCSWEKVISDEQYFKGTLFRFPLRNEASEISDNLYDSKKVTQLFESFIADTDISLLFLRSVSFIALLHIDINGVCNNKLKVSVSKNPVSPDNLELCDIKQEPLHRETCFKTISSMSRQKKETKSQWLVTHCLLKEGYRPEIDSLAKKLSFYPQVDVAFQLDEDRSFCNGRLSCFLPLPSNESNRTGLPVHINACFGLTDNRRYIKWQDEDQKNDEAAVWNELLMINVLPLVYLMMILDAIQLSKNSALPAASVYNLWPDLTKTVQYERWHKVAIDSLKHLCEYEIFHLADDETIWVSASRAVFPVNNLCSDTMSAVSRLLIAQGEKLVSAPKHVLEDVQETFPKSDALRKVTPSLVREVLHRSNVESLSKDDKYCLLEFVLSDEKYTELQGLKLLPLSNGTFTSFNNTKQNTVLIDSEKFLRTLLPFCKERFLPTDLNHSSTMHLRKLAARNTCNIINLDAKHIVALTKNHLPMDWQETQGHVTWKPTTDHHPPKSWLVEFWKFLSTECDDLSDFIGVPLIPLEPLQNSGNSVMLARLQRNTTLIFQNSRGSSLSDHVQNVIKKVGCTVVKRDECLKHHDIESYVLPASPKNVLQIFLNSNRDQLIKDFASASLHEKEEVKVYLSSVDSLSNAEQNFLSVLPIFRLMSGKYVAVKSKRAVVLSTNPAIPNSLPMPETIVQCANEADRRLLTLLNIDLLDATKVAILLVDGIKMASFNKDEEQSIMSWILNHGNILLSQSELLLAKTKDLKFIETTLGDRKQASNTFDPRIETFQDLFEVDFFPPSIYAKTQEMLQTLQRLGLKTEEKDISPENILQVVKHIEKLCIYSPNMAFKKADTLLKVLNRNTLLSKFTQTQKSELRQIQWVPCENPKCLNGSICKNQMRGLYKPVEVRDSKYFSLVGYVMPLNSELTVDVCKDLCLYDLPPAEKVLENISVLGLIAANMDKPDSDIQFKTKLHNIYKFMQDNIGNFKEAINTKGIPWLWNQSEFVSPRDTVLVYPPELDLSPYIKNVPKEFLQYENLLKEFGVKETLSDEEIEEVLHDIKQRIDDRDPPYGDSTELKVSVGILDWMRKNEKFLKDSTPVPVTTQSQNFTLQPLSKTVFCDISAEGLDDLKQDNEEFYVIHEEVLTCTARWLKVPFLSTRILKPQFIKAEQECFGIEQCGQSEPITQRIKNILKEYDEESDIFKELIQNAEDAGASTCKFLLDLRKHRDPPKTLIDDGMALCNGPCLWIFNDELFSEEDWKNIVKVGSASKENKVEKIGKFGLGFNAVYHVSDIPSILSGKSLLILDPNVTHLEKHILSKGNPGIKLDLFRERLYKRFPGQFRSYEGIFDCDLSVQNINKAYNGTLIKLPFRTEEEAKKSEISSKVLDEEHINSFKHHLTENSQTHLLFLKSIKSLSLQIVPENALTPPRDDQIHTPLKMTREVMNSIAVSNDTLLEEISVTLKKGNITCRNIIDYNRAQIVKIVQDHPEKPLTQYWLLYSCFGTQDSMRMFQRRNENEHVFSLPIGGIAVPLHRDGQTEAWSPVEDLCGQAFCFLPLPITTGLPVHVNGTFAVTSSRKALWERGVKSEWNKALLKDAVTSAYITTLFELKKMAQNGNLKSYLFYTFWPNTEKVSREFLPMVHSFYSAIAQNSKPLELFSNGHNWGSIDRVKFLSPKIKKTTTVGDIAKKVFLNMRESYSCVVSLPSWVKDSFSQCGFKDMIKERTVHWPEFYDVVFKNLTTMDTHSRNILVLNAIDLNDTAIDDLLRRYPCFPTQRCKNLQFIKKLVNPSGKVACLYELEEGRFLEGTTNDFLSPKRIQRLSYLGMLSDHLPLEDIIERAEKIPSAWQQDKFKCFKRIQCLIELMKDFPEDVNSLQWDLLSQIPFIPAVAPLHLQQNKNITILKKPSDVYSDICRDLVSMTEFTVDHTNLQIRSDDPVLEKLRVRTNPPVETVLQQLLKAHQHSNAFEKTLLYSIAQKSYEYLYNHLLEQKDPNPIIAHAKSFPFIFIEDCFVNVRFVARNEGFEEKPYLYVLPAIFSKYERLWECVGITKQFTKEQYIAALENLKSSYGPKPLSKEDLHKCVAILMKGLYKIHDVKLENCLIPDERGVLTSSRELRFNDSPWMPVSAGVKLSHELIPRTVACRFCVMTTRHYTLNNCLVNVFSPFVKEFGQTEKLTVRIKNIIDAYPSKKDILKELIQNADDAEATEIHFVWDKRQHSTEKIFGEKWKLVQGPALCVYNNKTFSDDDLRGIQQLGEGGKHGTLGRTGKYGLGFNSVYHLTDCPSILTGEKWLCISDPNLKYMEGVTKESPGRMFSLEKEFKKSFEDVYDTFLPGMFALDSGTMFRLPLRSEKMAEKSEISKYVVTDRDMKAIYSALTEDPEGLILFLKHITKIQFSVISKDEEEPKCFVIIEKKCTGTSKQDKENFDIHVKKCLVSGRAESCKTIYRMQISFGKNQSSWVIAECFGFFKQNINDGKNHLKVPWAALAACLGSTLTHSFTGRTFCSLPLPIKSGLPIHVNANFEVDSSRRDLWKEDCNSLKMKWNQSLKVNIIPPLYAELLSQLCKVMKKDTPTALTFLKNQLEYSCLQYFPCISKEVDKAWHEMILEVYRSVSQHDLLIIPTVHRQHDLPNKPPVHGTQLPKYTVNWCSVSRPDFADCPYFTSWENENIFDILDDIGMKLVPHSEKMLEIKNTFKAADVKVLEISPLTVMHFMKQRPLNDPTQTTKGLPLPINQTLIKDKERCSKLLNFCLSNTYEKKTVPDLNGLPLLLTQDQMLRVFNSKTPKMITRFSELFHRHQEMFADITVHGNHIRCLRKGKFITDLTIAVAAEYLKAELAHLLRESSPDQQCQLYKAEKETITWLKDLWGFFEDQGVWSQDEKQNVFSEIKRHFSDSPILPVTCPSQNNTQFLQRMKNVGKVILKSDEKMASILFKLGFMTLDCIFFIGITSFRLEHVDPELLHTGNSAAVLEQVYHVPHSQFELLSNDECAELQLFLQRGDFKNKSEYERMLKSLPLFETISGKRERIDLNRTFILKSEHHTTFQHLYAVDECDSIFLKDNWVNLDLEKRLNIQVLDDLKFCIMFILPSVHRMKEATLLDLLRLLVELKTVDQRIISELSKVRIIQDMHGCLRLASYFYDEQIRLYKKMLPEERFVPKKFWDVFKDKLCKARFLLMKLGLKHQVSDDEIIQFAKQIESDIKGNTPLNVLQERSTLLFQAVKIKSYENKSNLLSRMANIKFIFPVKIQPALCAYHKPFTQEREVVAISGSLIEKDSVHQYLIWTSMPILSSQHCSPQFIQKMMTAGALDTPPPEKISDNLKNICRSECQTDSLLKTREKVFSKSYAYLQSVDFNASLFSDLPIVLVENKTTLVKASQTALVLNNASEFRPYLYSIPSYYMIFVDFFTEIGVKERPALQQYITVLQEIHSDSSDKERLQANQQKTVQRTVEQLLCLIKENQKQTSDLNGSLYLPSTDGKLYESSTLFFNDTVYQASRLEEPLEKKLKLLEKLQNCHLGTDHYKHQKLLQLIPQQVRPRFLSNVISEDLVGETVQYCNYEEGCEFGDWFKQHLSSAAFLHGLVCLIREESRGEVSQAEAAQNCETIFAKIQIFCCTTLQTQLLLNLEPLEGSKNETDVYVQKHNDGCNFYLKHNDGMTHKVVNQVTMYLAKEINALLKNSLSTPKLPVIGYLLQCDDMEQVEETLAKFGIHNISHSEEGHSALPKPGCHVPEEWHDSLDMNFFNNFESGEYVGYSKDGLGEYFYAIVIEKLDDSLGETRPYSVRYKIQIGSDDFIEVSSLDLYQFKRETKDNRPMHPTCTDIQPFSTSAPPQKKVFPQTFEEIKREIDQSLTEIWKMSNEDKQKALKRLYLKWHPDKNPGNEDLATIAFKYLQNRIEELQQGKIACDTSSNGTDFWNDCFYRWNSEANSHRRGRERFYQNFSRHHYNFWSHHRETPRPNREEAKRWYEQAQCDLRAAQNDTGGESTEWCLFKVHQAVEKALIAAMYRRSGKHPNNCSITSLAKQVSDYSSQLSSLPNTVWQLVNLDVDGKKTQYPNYHTIPDIPNGQFNINNARAALYIATKLLVKIDQYISSS
ncbi:sacsin-like [Misgurnus anguillicaudatus]|uniref:sacsin-like n=1 Tax=Misgurnus anguillicaudatus TaxID=75329 RepID=UPI003CCF90CC